MKQLYPLNKTSFRECLQMTEQERYTELCVVILIISKIIGVKKVSPSESMLIARWCYYPFYPFKKIITEDEEIKLYEIPLMRIIPNPYIIWDLHSEGFGDYYMYRLSNSTVTKYFI